MANSAHTTAGTTDRDQAFTVGKLRARQAKITFGSDYAAAVLPVITANELGLAEVTAVIPTPASGTAVGCSVVPAIATGGASFTLALFNGATPIGTVDESATTVQLVVLGH